MPLRWSALGVTVEITTPDATVHQRLTQLFDGFLPSAESPDAAFAIRHEDRWVLAGDPDIHYKFDTPDEALARLVHEVNRVVVEHTPFVALHAGGVVAGDVAVLLPGEMEVGKTTLTAGLVRGGCRYLSDEAVGIDPVRGEALPYAKPLSIDPGAQHLFPELEAAGVRGQHGAGMQWQVPASALRPDAVAGATRVALIAYPRYEPGADTRLEPLRRAEALIELTRATFRFRDRAREALDVLAPVVRDAQAYRLVNGDLAAAVDCVISAAQRVAA